MDYSKIFIKEACPTSIGGQAIMEGIMMQGPDRIALALRLPSNEIYLRTKKKKPVKKIMKVPFVRGVVAFINSLVVGTSTLMESADILAEYTEDDEKYAHSVNYIPQYMNVNGVFKNQTIDNESIAMSKDFMQKFAHLMSREEALQLLQSSKKQEELFKILSIIFVSLTIITVPKKGLLKDKEDKKKLK